MSDRPNKKARKELRRLRILNILFFMIPSSAGRGKFVKKHNILAGFGEHCTYQSRNLPTDPKCVKIHNNVLIGTGVRFFCHDGLYDCFNYFDNRIHKQNLGCIEVMDNVWIGGNSIILPNVKLGPNAIIAGGSVVTKDVPEGSIVGGNPAKVIGSFYDAVEKSAERSKAINEPDRFDPNRIKEAWNMFEEKEKNQNYFCSNLDSKHRQ